MMMVTGSVRSRANVDALVDQKAYVVTVKPFPAEFKRGTVLMKEGTAFQFIRKNDAHGNVWCRDAVSGEIFIIRSIQLRECLQEGRLQRIAMEVL